MISCRICIEQAKNPVSLPCGHIFCTNCIVKCIRAVKHFTHFHPCPLCRSIYNIAPVNLKMVPPNLRSFVTPSIRRLYIEPHSPDVEEGNDTLITPSTSSEISRLETENCALRNHCAMWRRHAEIQDLNVIKLAGIIRDQASDLAARERAELEKRDSWLRRKPDDDELLAESNATSCTNQERSVKVEELLEPPLSSVSSFSTSPVIDVSVRPRKRLRIATI